MSFTKTIQNKQTVLIAEDHNLTRVLISELLIKSGFKVVEAANGKEAIDIYMKESSHIGAIVSDIRMPELGGVEFAKYNYNHDKLPFLVCTTVEDSRLALELLQYGVQDYAVKPVNIGSIGVRVKHSISRYINLTCGLESSDRLRGNVDSISISSRKKSLFLAIEWVREQVANIFDKREILSFLMHMHEFLLNAHEHGNLGLSESDKTELIENGHFESRLAEMEKSCSAKIKIEMSVLQSEISIKVKDEGSGFNYQKHLNMSENELNERILMPNGRGILMCSKYFDSIEYSDGGASVQLTKSVTSF